VIKQTPYGTEMFFGIDYSRFKFRDPMLENAPTELDFNGRVVGADRVYSPTGIVQRDCLLVGEN
jgi:hypothetical protein